MAFLLVKDHHRLGGTLVSLKSLGLKHKIANNILLARNHPVFLFSPQKMENSCSFPPNLDIFLK